MLNFLPRFKSTNLSIDLGTANTLIYMDGQIVLNEPSVVAIRDEKFSRESVILAVGAEAKSMLGRTPSSISAVRPMRDGVIADFKITEKMLQYFIRKILKSRFFNPSPKVLICVPCGATQVERRAIKESALGAGAKEVFLIEEPMAAALGAGIPIEEAAGSMVVDIGGGTTEIAVLSLNGIVYSNSIRVGGDRFDEAIIKHIRREYGVVIGEASAEKIKKEIGTALSEKEVKELDIVGLNVSEGIPSRFKISSTEISQALQEPLTLIIGAIRTALEQTPPELVSDIAERGLTLTGGGVLLHNLDVFINQEVKLPVYIADDPFTCVVRGGGIALKMIGERKMALLSSE